MNKFSDLSTLDKVATLLVFLNLSFWSFSKVPQIAMSTLFSSLYNAIWLYMIVVALLGTFYFLFKWIDVNLKIKSVYCYGFLFGLVTLVIMRFV